MFSILKQKPNAIAQIKGSESFPNIRGCVNFYQTKKGTLVAAEIFGLPCGNEICKKDIFAFHIHDGNSCCEDKNAETPFPKSGVHYNPNNCTHPRHAGDMPPLFGNKGYAFSLFLTDRFCVNEILRKTVIIHSGTDDFISQPAGNSGKKIACGEIKGWRNGKCQ
ncbi:MAG: superoxide dismutase family protein [Clostridia bacterium]|nr:superoxide dismutase family protein [Clostridia bacterium]